MTKLLEAYLACSVTMAGVTLALYALSPQLGKRYRAQSLYAAWLAVLLGFLIPLGMVSAQPRITVQIPAAITRPVRGQSTMPDDASPSAMQSEASTFAAEPSFSGAAASGGSSTTVYLRAGGAADAGMARPSVDRAALTWLELAAFLWLLGATATFLAQLARHALFLRTVRRWQDEITNAQTLCILAAEKRRLHVRQSVRLMLCPSVSSPMMIGLFKSRLLLPDEELTGEELALVFRHELTHLKRGDLWVKAALMLAVSLHWFNPAAYLMARALGFWQESASDERVTAAGTREEKQFYSETIIRVIRRQARVRSLVTTSFYGGRNGMKRRIIGILESGGKRVGAMVGVVTLAMVAALGIAFAVDVAPETGALSEPLLAYVTGIEGEGASMLTQPTVNDLDVPLAVYFTGTPVTIVEKRASSAPEEWGSQAGELNWARVLVGGDGERTGVSGWIPLRYLTAAPQALPTATLSTDNPTGHVNLYLINDDDAALLGVYRAGTPVTLLGRVQKWFQIKLEGQYGFVARENLTMDEATLARYDTFRPYRFDTYDRTSQKDAEAFWNLYNQKAQAYGGADVESWSFEDKAWYAQMEAAFSLEPEYYLYQMPDEGDLQSDKAADIAWNTFVTRCGLEAAKREDYLFSLGFYAVDKEQSGKEWSVGIRRKGSNVAYDVTLASPSGAIVRTTDASAYLDAQGAQGGEAIDDENAPAPSNG